jgi:hypothetical protein
MTENDEAFSLSMLPVDSDGPRKDLALLTPCASCLRPLLVSESLPKGRRPARIEYGSAVREQIVMRCSCAC